MRLAAEGETQEGDAKQFVRTTIAGVAELGQCDVSAPISINGNGAIRVVVFNPVKTAVQ